MGNNQGVSADAQSYEEIAIEDAFFDWVDTIRPVLKEKYKFSGKDRKLTYQLLTVLFIYNLV